MPLQQNLTDQELLSLKGDDGRAFPALTRLNAEKTGGGYSTVKKDNYNQPFGYNCIGWAMIGNEATAPNVNPPVILVNEQVVTDPYQTIIDWAAAQPEFAEVPPLQRCEANVAEIRFYRKWALITHADRKNQARDYFESKMGPFSIRILHEANALETSNAGQSDYGLATYFFKFSNNKPGTKLDPIEVKIDEGYGKEIDEMEGVAKINIPKTFAEMDTYLKGWTASVKKAGARDTNLYAKDANFQKVVAFCQKSPVVLPKVVNLLHIRGQEGFGMVLYNELQWDAKLKLTIKDPNYWNVPNHETTLFNLYGALAKQFSASAAAWVNFQKTVTTKTAAAMTNHTSFKTLVTLGPAIVPLAMIRYAKEKTGWWHELLYQLTNGKPSDGPWDDKALFKKWMDTYAPLG